MKKETGMGQAAARETLLRYLLCQFLTKYANEKFELSKTARRPWCIWRRTLQSGKSF